jgi:Ni,Fe-hydrogenase III large subunit
MSNEWPQSFIDQLRGAGVAADVRTAPGLAPAQLIELAPEHWGELAKAAQTAGARWVAGFGEDAGARIVVNACFERAGAYALARTAVDRAAATLRSHVPYFPGADRPERHLRDMFGVTFTDHPDKRRWTRHQAWREHEHPLRKDFPVAGHAHGSTPADHNYQFLFAHGTGVYEIPVGPVHAGIIEPGHFRFQAVGETVLNLEERLGYVHKGIEKIAEGRDAEGLARLAARVSGDSTVAHAWAACMAMERAAGLDVPARAAALRALMAERERVANHLGDIGAILNDVAFTFGFYQFGRLREQWQRLSREIFGHRFMMDRIVPGGVALDIDERAVSGLREQSRDVGRQIDKLNVIVAEQPSVEDRLVTTGMLKPDHARALGCLGYVGRASDIAFDLRRDAPYPPYDRLNVTVPVYRDGDVAARMRVRIEECRASFELIEQIVNTLPDGPIRTHWRAPAADAEGLGLVEGWRGEILAYVRFDAHGKIARYFPRDPSVCNWPALEYLIHDNIVPDFPVCNKSVNGSYSGNDL